MYQFFTLYKRFSHYTPNKKVDISSENIITFYKHVSRCYFSLHPPSTLDLTTFQSLNNKSCNFGRHQLLSSGTFISWALQFTYCNSCSLCKKRARLSQTTCSTSESKMTCTCVSQCDEPSITGHISFPPPPPNTEKNFKSFLSYIY